MEKRDREIGAERGVGMGHNVKEAFRPGTKLGLRKDVMLFLPDLGGEKVI